MKWKSRSQGCGLLETKQLSGWEKEEGEYLAASKTLKQKLSYAKPAPPPSNNFLQGERSLSASATSVTFVRFMSHTLLS